MKRKSANGKINNNVMFVVKFDARSLACLQPIFSPLSIVSDVTFISHVCLLSDSGSFSFVRVARKPRCAQRIIRLISHLFTSPCVIASLPFQLPSSSPRSLVVSYFSSVVAEPLLIQGSTLLVESWGYCNVPCYNESF